MTLRWYEWRPIRDKLFSFGRAVQGVSPYRIRLEPDKCKCPTGYTSFSQRLIMVNPTLFDVKPEEQRRLTKAALCHDAGHRRFTAPNALPPHVQLVSNLPEDERIERLMEEVFAGVGSLLSALSAALLDKARPLDPTSGSPIQVWNYLPQLRWAQRGAGCR